MSKKQILVFVGCMVGFAAFFFLLPIEMFDGEVVIQQMNREIVLDQKLSLSYFIGIGYDEADIAGVKEFHLTGMGYFLAFLMIVMLPFLIAIRVGISDKSKSET